MKALKYLLVLTVVAGLFATGAFAVAPLESVSKVQSMSLQNVESDPPGPPVFFSDACPPTDVGMLASDGSTTIPGNTCGSANDYENDGSACSYGGGSPDEIFQFTVDASGVWQVDTATICAGWDTSLMIREETGGGCPGDWLACDGDSGHGACGSFESLVQTFLATGTTYYLVVDGWSSLSCGPFEVTSTLLEPCCTEDADCDDGVFCNGAETCPDPCPGGPGECLAGAPPCAFYQNCDEDNQACIDPDPCLSWMGGPDGTTFSPYCAAQGYRQEGTWQLDDIELDRTCTDVPAVLLYYDMQTLGRNFCGTPIGNPYFMDLALWDVLDDGSCNPGTIIPGSECGGVQAFIEPGGTPADTLTCAPGPLALPDNSGDFMRCEIDFFMGYLGAVSGTGFAVPSGPQIIGGLAGDEDFGVSVWWLETAPASGIFGASWFGDDVGSPADFCLATVCTDNLGVCCEGLDICTEGITLDNCGVIGDTWHACVFWDPPDCGDPDGDGIATICGDNCPGVGNPGQEDCDGGMTPEGDACETDNDYRDNDGDGVCNVDDPCPDNGFITVLPSVCDCADVNPNLWNGVNDPADSDGDGTADCVDDCPSDPNKDTLDVCGCGGGPMCGFNQPCDSDGDGVPDCVDQCPGVDDAIFAPGCVGAIPTVTGWGLLILALLLLVAGKVYFSRRAATS